MEEKSCVFVENQQNVVITNIKTKYHTDSTKKAKLKFEKSGPAGILKGGCVLLKSKSEQQQTTAHNKDSRGSEDKNIPSKEDTNYNYNKEKKSNK